MYMCVFVRCRSYAVQQLGIAPINLGNVGHNASWLWGLIIKQLIRICSTQIISNEGIMKVLHDKCIRHWIRRFSARINTLTPSYILISFLSVVFGFAPFADRTQALTLETCRIAWPWGKGCSVGVFAGTWSMFTQRCGSTTTPSHTARWEKQLVNKCLAINGMLSY